MCSSNSSNMDHQAARTQEEATTPYPTMSCGDATSSQANRQSRQANPLRRKAQGSSSSSSKTSTVFSLPSSTPQSPTSSILSSNPEALDLGLDPATILNAYHLDRPSSVTEVYNHLETLKYELTSNSTPKSQYLFVQRIPADLFTALQDTEKIKGVRAAILIYDHAILYKVLPTFHHEKIISTFNCWINDTLSPMGLRQYNQDFWLGGSGEVTGRFCKKQADSCFFPGKYPGLKAPKGWPTVVLEVGFSESLRQLRNDARWWYANSGFRTKLIVLISANPTSGDSEIEIWKEVGSVLEYVQEATFKDRAVSGDTLKIDFQTLMGRPPMNPNETDLYLTPPWIERMCECD